MITKRPISDISRLDVSGIGASVISNISREEVNTVTPAPLTVIDLAVNEELVGRNELAGFVEIDAIDGAPTNVNKYPLKSPGAAVLGCVAVNIIDVPPMSTSTPDPGSLGKNTNDCSGNSTVSVTVAETNAVILSASIGAEQQ